MNDDELRSAIGENIWFHSIELRPGIVTPGPKRPELLEAEASAYFSPIDLVGRSVLDVGAWNGFFSFEAKRRGASRVLATDSFTWRHPEYRGRETLMLAREQLNLDVETLEIDAGNISSSIGIFDVTLFLGVFYHLVDPIAVLSNLRSVTSRLLIIETHQDALSLDQPAMIFYPGIELDNDPTNWWGPNPELVFRLLKQVGFKKIFYQDHPLHRFGSEFAIRRRGIYHAFIEDDNNNIIIGDHDWIDLDDPEKRRSLVVR